MEPGSFPLDTGELDRLAPLLGFLGDEFAQVGGSAPEAGRLPQQAVPLPRIGEATVDFHIELVDNLGRRFLGRADPTKVTGLSRSTAMAQQSCEPKMKKDIMVGMKTPTLLTPRLTLRPLTLEDASAIQKHFANWNIIQHIGGQVPWPYPADGAETFVRENALPRMSKGDAHLWAICSRETPNELIGVIEFRVVTRLDHHRGFWLAEPYWRRGLMSEAVEAVNRFVFEDLGIDSFLEENAANNLSSRRLKEKSGGEFLCYRESHYLSGECRSEVWKLSRNSWLAKQGK